MVIAHRKVDCRPVVSPGVEIPALSLILHQWQKLHPQNASRQSMRQRLL